MSWQQVLELAAALLAIVCLLVALVADWHDRNFRRIPREALVSHRITPRLPLGDWKND